MNSTSLPCLLTFATGTSLIDPSFSKITVNLDASTVVKFSKESVIKVNVNPE